MTTDNDKVHLYRDAAGEYRWKRKAANGDEVAESGEGYVNHGDALEQAQRNNPGVPVVDETRPEA